MPACAFGGNSLFLMAKMRRPFYSPPCYAICRWWLLAVLLGLLTLPVAAKPAKELDIADTIAANRITTKFAAIVQASELATFLSSRGPFTIFVPTDSAFAKLPPGTLETLLLPENKERPAGHPSFPRRERQEADVKGSPHHDERSFLRRKPHVASRDSHLKGGDAICAQGKNHPFGHPVPERHHQRNRHSPDTAGEIPSPTSHYTCARYQRAVRHPSDLSRRRNQCRC